MPLHLLYIAGQSPANRALRELLHGAKIGDKLARILKTWGQNAREPLTALHALGYKYPSLVKMPRG